MNNPVQKKLIVKMALEALQNVLPTNIMGNLEKFDEDDDSDTISDELDEERFIYRKLSKSENNGEPVNESFVEPLENVSQIDPNASLTYFEIVEQEMMQSLPVTKENITV